MKVGSTLFVFFAAFASGLALTQLVRRYALARSILDRPNSRSLHDQPTPRGGGLAIASTFLLGVTVLGVIGLIPVDLVIALGAGGSLIALMGWLDDRSDVKPIARGIAHTAAAVWALAWLGGVQELQLGNYSIHMGLAGNLLAVVGIVWWINLYNFMDGIDGIAGGHALTVAVAAAFLIGLIHPDAIGLVVILLAGAAGGFLILNWAPARIFMGDTGSGFLGFVFAVLAVASERAGALPIIYWVLLSGVFIFDSTVTLIRRAIRGERWYMAHRSHAYQRLVSLGYSHARVTSGVLAANVLIGAMLAFAAIGWLNLAVAAAIELIALSASYLLIEHAFPMPPRAVPTSPTEAGHA